MFAVWIRDSETLGSDGFLIGRVGKFHIQGTDCRRYKDAPNVFVLANAPVFTQQLGTCKTNYTVFTTTFFDLPLIGKKWVVRPKNFFFWGGGGGGWLSS